MKSSRKELLITTLLCLLPIAAGLALYSKLPETVPTHFGFNGEANGWSSRATAVFTMPLMMAGLNLFMHFGLSTDPKRQNMSASLRAISIWTVPVVSILVSAFILGNALGAQTHIEVVIPLLTGILFILIGNYLPKTKQSYTMGIKLPWTLASEENWNRTHRLAGFLWVLGGAADVLVTLLRLWTAWLFIVLIAVLTLVPSVYSYLLYKKGI